MTYNWSDFTVLIAEDDPINFKYLQLLLEKYTGISILWGKTGKDTLHKFKKNKQIDIVLLDYQLPDINGLEILSFIREKNSEIPVIMQTANSLNDEEFLCKEAGCNGFFTKPIKTESMLQFMHDCIAKYQYVKIKVNSTIELKSTSKS